MTTASHPTAAGKATELIRWALVNLFLAVIAVGVTLWVLLRAREMRAEIAELTAERVEACTRRVLDAPPMVDTAVQPRQDRPRTGYFGRAGVEIRETMRVKLEALHAGQPPDAAPHPQMLGSAEVLPPNTIFVINLWATWCTPCLDELPDLKALFARRSDWGARVRFVPILVKDATAPGRAYGDSERIMPRAPVWLVDRRLGDPLVTSLSTSEQRRLFAGGLPVTLVLDCNRRVRWAQFEQLSSADFSELETYVDRFVEELDDTSPGSWCTQEWAGNGRCEGLEGTAAHHSIEDCGELDQQESRWRRVRRDARVAGAAPPRIRTGAGVDPMLGARRGVRAP